MTYRSSLHAGFIRKAICRCALAVLILILDVPFIETLWAQERAVNTFNAGEQSNPLIAMNPDGHFVVVWQSWSQDGSGYGIYGQRYNAASEAQGSEFRVNSFTNGNQKCPSVTMDRAGNFIIVWQSSGQNGAGVDIYAKIYDNEGSQKGDEFMVHTPSSVSRYSPSVAMDGSGDFVVVWQSWSEQTNAFGIFARRFRSDGTPAGDEFPVDDLTAYPQYSPEVAINSHGTFVVVWQRDNGEGHEIHAQAFDSRGKKRGKRLLLNKDANNEVVRASVDMNSKGAFVVTWQKSPLLNGQYTNGIIENRISEIYAVSYNERLAPVTGPFQVNIYTDGFQNSSDAALDANGNFIIIWQNQSRDGGLSGIFARKFSLNGEGIGGEFQINTLSKAPHSSPSVAMDETGNFTAVWQRWTGDDSGNDIIGRNFSSDVTGPLIFSTQISASEDDAEELLSSGDIDLSSSDLELLYDKDVDEYQMAGLHFQNIGIPKGSSILSSQIQFKNDENRRGFAAIKIQGEAGDNPPAFKVSNKDISSRLLTSRSVTWYPAAWTVKGETDVHQQTPNIASVIQEIVDRSGWSEGNSINLIFSEAKKDLSTSYVGPEPRIAESFNGDPEGTPMLQILYTAP